MTTDSENERNIAKNAKDFIGNQERRFTMGPYEIELMKELDAQEKLLEKNERASRGYEPLGDGSYTRRSGCCDEPDELD